MAEITKSVIGKISGSLGNMVFRNIGDKVFVYMRPHNQKISYTDESVKNRGKFGLTSLLSKNARLLPGIDQVWMSSSEPGRSAYTKIIKANSKVTLPDRLITSNLITPIGFRLKVDSVVLTDEKLVFEFSLSNEVKEFIFPAYNANTLLFLYQPVNQESELKYYFIPLTKFVEEEITNLEYTFDDTLNAIFKQFRHAVVYFALTKLTERKVFWTSNFSTEIDLQ